MNNNELFTIAPFFLLIVLMAVIALCFFIIRFVRKSIKKRDEQLGKIIDAINNISNKNDQ